MQTLGYDTAVSLNDLVSPFIQPFESLALQTLEFLDRVIIVKNRFLRVQSTMNLRIQRHNLD